MREKGGEGREEKMDGLRGYAIDAFNCCLSLPFLFLFPSFFLSFFKLSLLLSSSSFTSPASLTHRGEKTRVVAVSAKNAQVRSSCQESTAQTASARRCFALSLSLSHAFEWCGAVIGFPRLLLCRALLPSPDACSTAMTLTQTQLGPLPPKLRAG